MRSIRVIAASIMLAHPAYSQINFPVAYESDANKATLREDYQVCTSGNFGPEKTNLVSFCAGFRNALSYCGFSHCPLPTTAFRGGDIYAGISLSTLASVLGGNFTGSVAEPVTMLNTSIGWVFEPQKSDGALLLESDQITNFGASGTTGMPDGLAIDWQKMQDLGLNQPNTPPMQDQ